MNATATATAAETTAAKINLEGKSIAELLALQAQIAASLPKGAEKTMREVAEIRAGAVALIKLADANVAGGYDKRSGAVLRKACTRLHGHGIRAYPKDQDEA